MVWYSSINQNYTQHRLERRQDLTKVGYSTMAKLRNLGNSFRSTMRELNCILEDIQSTQWQSDMIAFFITRIEELRNVLGWREEEILKCVGKEEMPYSQQEYEETRFKSYKALIQLKIKVAEAPTKMREVGITIPPWEIFHNLFNQQADGGGEAHNERYENVNEQYQIVEEEEEHHEDEFDAAVADELEEAIADEVHEVVTDEIDEAVAEEVDEAVAEEVDEQQQLRIDYELQLEQLRKALDQKQNMISLYQREHSILEKEKKRYCHELEIARKEKESIVLKFADQEKLLIDAKKEKDVLEKQLTQAKRKIVDEGLKSENVTQEHVIIINLVLKTLHTQKTDDEDKKTAQIAKKEVEKIDEEDNTSQESAVKKKCESETKNETQPETNRIIKDIVAELITATSTEGLHNEDKEKSENTQLRKIITEDFFEELSAEANAVQNDDRDENSSVAVSDYFEFKHKFKEKNNAVQQSKIHVHKVALSFIVTLLHNKLKSMPESYRYLKPVNKRQIKDFYTIIKRLMDLETMNKKVDAHRFHSRAEYLSDLELITNNCAQYNGEQSIFTQNTRNLIDHAGEELDGLRVIATV